MRMIISAELVETIRANEAEHAKYRREVFWTGIATAAFVGAAVCFVSGVIVSLATAIGFISASPGTSRWTLGLLFSAFVFAFGGAHALDKRSLPCR